MRYCSNCGTQNESDAVFCSACGTRLDSAPAEAAAPAPEMYEAAPAPEVNEPAPAPEAFVVPPAPEFPQEPQEFAQQAPPAFEEPQFQQPQGGYVPPQQPQGYPQQGFQQGYPQQGFQQGYPQQGFQQGQGYPQQPYAPYQPQGAPAELSAKCKTFGIIGFILGLISVVFCWLGIFPAIGIILGFIMLAFAIVGLIFCGVSRKAGEFKLAKVGKVFSIIGICLTAIIWIIGIIITATGGYYLYY